MTSKKKIDTFNNNNKIFLQQVSCPEEQIPFIHAIFGETVSRKKSTDGITYLLVTSCKL